MSFKRVPTPFRWLTISKMDSCSNGTSKAIKGYEVDTKYNYILHAQLLFRWIPVFPVPCILWFLGFMTFYSPLKCTLIALKHQCQRVICLISQKTAHVVSVGATWILFRDKIYYHKNYRTCLTYIKGSWYIEYMTYNFKNIHNINISVYNNKT